MEFLKTQEAEKLKKQKWKQYLVTKQELIVLSTPRSLSCFERSLNSIFYPTLILRLVKPVLAKINFGNIMSTNRDYSKSTYQRENSRKQSYVFRVAKLQYTNQSLYRVSQKKLYKKFRFFQKRSITKEHKIIQTKCISVWGVDSY